MLDLRLPHLTAQSTPERLEQLSSYIYQLVEKLNVALNVENAVSDSSQTGTKYASDMLAIANQCSVGVTSFYTDDRTLNLPTGNYKNALGIVHKQSSNKATVYIQSYSAPQIALNVYNGTWSGWKYLTPQ